MSETTWLMVLGAIAIITPLVILGLNDYVGESTLSDSDYLDYGTSFNSEHYNLIQNITCDNIYEDNSLSITNFELLDLNREYFEFSNWIRTSEINIGCFIGSSYVSNHIDRFLLNESVIINLFDDTTDEGKTRNFFNRMNPQRFFEVLNEFPPEIKYVIYTFYLLFFGYLIYKAVTLA